MTTIYWQAFLVARERGGGLGGVLVSLASVFVVLLAIIMLNARAARDLRRRIPRIEDLAPGAGHAE